MGNKRRIWILISTILLIGLVFAYYFLVHVKNREEMLLLNNIRILHQVKSNLQTAVESKYKQLTLFNPEQFDQLGLKFKKAANKDSTETYDLKQDGVHVRREEYPDSVYIVPYEEIFNNDLLVRSDVFEFVSIIGTDSDKTEPSILYSSSSREFLMTNDSLSKNLREKQVFEQNTGVKNYLVFNTTLVEEKNLYLCAFLDLSFFQKEKREVSSTVITFAIITAILLLLALPVLKLKFMSNVERLYIRDVVNIGISVILTPAILLLLFFFFLNNQKERAHEKEKLQDLHSTVSNNLYRELDAVVKQLEFADAHLDEFEGNESNLLYNDCVSIKYLNSLFWTDDKARFKIYSVLANERDALQGIDLSHRKYITKILSKDTILFKDKPIAFESIRSVTDGSYEIGIGIKSRHKSCPVIASSFPLISLMHPILEEGYGFALFSEDDQTKFHSEINHNMNENFIEETQYIFDSPAANKVPAFESVNYNGEEYLMYFKPLDSLESHYLATFVKSDYVYSPVANAINLTVGMQSTFLILLSVFYAILYGVTRKPTSLRQRIFAFNWLRPYQDLNGKYSFIYFKLFIVNLFYLAGISAYCLLFFFTTFNEDFIIAGILYFATFSVSANYYILSRRLPFHKKIHTTFIADPVESEPDRPFPASPEPLVNQEKEQSRSKSIHPVKPEIPASRTGLRVIITCLVLVILGGKYILYSNDHWGINTVYDVIFTILFALSVVLLYIDLTKRNLKLLNYYVGKMVKRIRRFQALTRIAFGSYKAYITSLVLTFSVLPVIIFFHLNYNKEKEILFKHRGLELKRDIENYKTARTADYFEMQGKIKTSTVADVNLIFNSIVSHTDYIFPSPATGNIKFGEYTTETDNSGHWYSENYHTLRVPINKYTETTNTLGTNNSDSAYWFFKGNQLWFTGSKDTARNPLTLTESLKRQKLSAGILFSHDSHMTVPVIILGFACFLILIVVVFKLVNDTISRIFGLHLLEYARRYISHYDYRRNLVFALNSKSSTKNDSFNNFYFTGVNASHTFGIKNLLLNRSKKERIYLINIDFLNCFEGDSPALNPSFFRSVIERELHRPVVVFIEHFEYGYNDFALNRKKIGLIREIIDHPEVRVIISSEISPHKLYEEYENQIKLDTSGQKGKESKNTNEKTIEGSDVAKDLVQLQHLLGSFYQILVPVHEYYGPLRHNKVFQEELSYGEYLFNLSKRYDLGRKLKLDKKAVSETDNLKKISYEDFVINVQEHSYSYYYSIWNSLSEEERYIVYDIAKDKFVNTNNSDGIIELLHKGILKYDYSLRLMNDSFTNFILSKVNSDDALEKELEVRKKGSWNTASAVMVILIVSLVIFVSFGKVNFLSDINALLTSVAAMIGLLVRLGGISLGSRSTT